MKSYMFIPIDQAFKENEYPTIENTKDKILASLSTLELVEGPNDDQEEGDYNNNNAQPDNEFEAIMKETHKDWIEVLVFSHNVQHNNNKPYLGELSISRYSSHISPILNYSHLKGEIYPRIIMHIYYSLKGKTFTLYEYELFDVWIASQSLSGHSSKQIENISLGFEKLINKGHKINVETGEHVSHRIGTWDGTQNKGSRSLVNISGIKPLEQGLVDDLNEQGIKSLKEKGLFAEQLPYSKDIHCHVLFNKDPLLLKRFVVKGKPTRQSIIDAIATKLSRKPIDIQGLYSQAGVEIETDDDVQDEIDFFIKIDNIYLGK